MDAAFQQATSIIAVLCDLLMDRFVVGLVIGGVAGACFALGSLVFAWVSFRVLRFALRVFSATRDVYSQCSKHDWVLLRALATIATTKPVDRPDRPHREPVAFCCPPTRNDPFVGAGAAAPAAVATEQEVTHRVPDPEPPRPPTLQASFAPDPACQ